MPGFLKSFIIQEDLRVEHAERFLLYKERYHHEVIVDLKKSLEKAWEHDASALSRAHKIKDDDLQYALLQNPAATVKITIESKSEKFNTSRHRETIEVSPSAKVPLLYSKEERDLIIKTLIKSSEAVMKDITDRWSEIFKVEKKGRATPWFKITHDHDEVRLQLVLSAGKSEMYKTLYAVRIEFGKPNSKTKDFDRVYLISLSN